ncbi:Nitrogen assimilation transcription factor nit-4 [Cercospora beticola]|uniref:Nitrogen assimilation transcription factor nit-4 n=1 Tax=Cercospora beticola TaxID=122368 RepID=A0A2G5HMG0_CERBT|nr:Nitrogen assimilation transcription factor nit-4 [Cercospora beticola]PIA93746.1 Nitrogen assimilation transcription factor nit-4 [Cercospora beticola]WPB02511.1 hypothetical protein RHO25_007147 [Cercospora beticola]
MPPRPIRPKNEPLSSESSDIGDGKGGKRKAVSSACIPCRKRKSKCDGNVPACSTCIAVYRTECSYDADSDHRRKGALKRDIQSLQQQNDALDVIVASLRSLPENEAIALLHNLRSDTNPNVLADSLRSNVRLPHSYAQQTLEADFAQQITTPTSATSTVPPSLSRDNSGEQSHRGSVSSIPEQSGQWLRIPHDAEFIEHLMSLYQCWIHPFYTFLCWDHFTHDMSRGRTDYCSALLVNAVLAFACHYSDRALARTDPSNPSTAGDHFYAEAKRLLDSNETSTLTTVQALGIMSLRETSAGRDSDGYRLAGRCVRMALELGLHLSVIKDGMREREAEVRKVTFWAVFNLETTCSVAFGRLSQLPRSAADIDTPAANVRSETMTWRPYEDTNLPLSASAEQPARTMLFKDQLSKLSELASDMVNTFYAPRERFTSRKLAATYAQYQAWYQNLPDCFRLENTSLPHVLVLHMYYYGCILHLFRPYIRLDLRAANLYPRDTCTFCANEISALMNALRAMYGLRRVTLAVTSLLLSASTIHLLNLPSEQAANHLSQALHDLESMSVNHKFAARAAEIILALSSKWNIALPEAAAAIAVYRMGSGTASPPPSSFFAASIPRELSGGSQRTRSGDSASIAPSATPHRESPFLPPQQQGPTSVPFFYSDPTTPLDERTAQAAFWTPFPTQVMPIAQQDLGLGEFSGSGGQQVHNWAMYGGTGASQTVMDNRHHSDPGQDHHMGDMDAWSWG